MGSVTIRRAIGVPSAALVLAIGVPGLVRQEKPRTESKIASLIASLEGRWWDSAVGELVAIGEPAVGPLIAHLGVRTGPEAARACLPLAPIGTPRALDAVFGALSAPHVRVREHAATAHGSVRSERSVTALSGVTTLSAV